MIRDDWRNFIRTWSRLQARAWLDESFKQSLISDPVTVLAENGLRFPSGVEVRVQDNSDRASIWEKNPELSLDSDLVFEIPLHAKPDIEQLTDELLMSWADGSAEVTPPGFRACF
ncbi:MAG TPA: hypothetical protein DDZ80_23250 [Cyanobacteria bacterium UBA8803]|nr:hypothetical protein [Cyanobacteria bacterium UBA9273]HBL61243.1 hypothetical protein [Cyanobacteria bacterium UBA8803]